MDSGSDVNENRVEQKPPVFRTFDDGYVVRGMTLADAKIVQKWYAGMGIISPYDLDVTLESFPPGPGFYIGEYEGEVVASCVRLPWGNRAYYGSYYYVDERYRAKGFGTRLRDQVAREHVGDNILCVDAVMGSVASKNAAKFGYVEAFVTRRFMTTSAKADYGEKCEGKLVTASEVPFQQMIDFDNEHFISRDNPARRKFLEKWFQISGGSTVVCLDPSGKVVGYGTRRPAMEHQPKNHLLGPLYAETPGVARAILQELCKGVAGDAVTCNMWTPNEACLKMMEDFQFETVFDVLRMHVNGNPQEYKDTVYFPTNIETCGF